MKWRVDELSEQKKNYYHTFSFSKENIEFSNLKTDFSQLLSDEEEWSWEILKFNTTTERKK